LFGSCIILYTECVKIKENNSGAEGLIFKAKSQENVIICVNVNMRTGYFFRSQPMRLKQYYLRRNTDNELTKLRICSQKLFRQQ